MSGKPEQHSYYQNVFTRYHGGDPPIFIDDLVIGDVVLINLKTRHYLKRVVRNRQELLEPFFARKHGSKNFGSQIFEVRGNLQEIDTINQEFKVSVGPGGYGWKHQISALARIPWYAISRILVYRPRIYDGDQINSRFPIVTHVAFSEFDMAIKP
jgi:hypothetical protein